MKKSYRFFKTVGFYSPDRIKGDKLVAIEEIEWQQKDETNRAYAILKVEEYLHQGNGKYVKVKDTAAHYVWKFDDDTVEYPIDDELWAEEVYIPKEKVILQAV